MRWFKHMADAVEDEAVANLIAEHGLIYYARWWRILETIAKQMNETDRCAVRYCQEVWANILACKPRHVANILAMFSEHRLLVVDISDGLVKVECKNLLKIRARSFPYSERKSRIEVDIEVDKEIEVEKKSIRRDIENHFDVFWKAYPNKKGKTKALQIWKRLNLNPDENLKMMEALAREKLSSQWMKDEGQFIPHPSTWLGQRRWEDEGYDSSTIPKEDFSNEAWEKLLKQGATK